MDIKAKFRDKVSKLLFLEMDKDRLKRFFNIDLSESVYMPLKSSSLYEKIEKNESLEEVNLGFFIEGMFYVLGGDPSFRFNGVYKEILFEDNYIKYIKGIIAKYVKENNLEDAYILIKGLLIVEPSKDNYDKYFYLAKELYFLDKEYKDDLLEVIDKTKEIKDYATGYLIEGIIKKEEDDFQGALFSLNTYISKGGEETEEVKELMDGLSKVRAYEKGKELLHASPVEALNYLVPLVEDFKDDAILYYYIGKGYRLAERYDLAIEALNMALALDNDLVDVVYEMGLSYACLGDYKTAIEYFRKTFESLKTIEVCTNLIMCYYYLGDMKNAKLHVDIAEKINSNDEVLKQIKDMLH